MSLEGRKQLVALDLDGTLLNEKHAVSARNKAKLHELAELGVIVTLASGRSGPAQYHIVESLALPCDESYTVAYNGAVGYRFGRGFAAATPAAHKEVVFKTPLDPECANFMIAFAQREGLLAQVYVGDHIYVCCKSDEHYDLARRYTELTSCSHVFLDDDYASVPRDHVAKLLLMTDDPDAVLAKVTAESDRDGVAATLIRGSPPFFVEVLNPAVTKGAALTRLCERLQVDLAHVVAFGDGDNDIEMIQSVGLGVAMKNARPTLAAVADRITTLDNAHDGVADFI
eukprot:CAMPEP_0197396962 /NCGR_PEP_ID=MMETSP1165-20131217/10617_1 /TAXON_ID=284809 /ORGANISM="Chrysocystis fragilis, Strain CCMP3189" /LENGTH=284 /DNA_ID=CAMNT_0042922835 /DNA_START=1 /DNA_END=852 /DNA_ORIENTATION=-